MYLGCFHATKKVWVAVICRNTCLRHRWLEVASSSIGTGSSRNRGEGISSSSQGRQGLDCMREYTLKVECTTRNTDKRLYWLWQSQRWEGISRAEKDWVNCHRASTEWRLVSSIQRAQRQELAVVWCGVSTLAVAAVTGLDGVTWQAAVSSW